MYWLVTWTTYGSWLPGDPRGFRTWRGREFIPPPPRYAEGGDRPFDPAEYRTRYLADKSRSLSTTRLTADQQQVAIDAVVEDISALLLEAIIVSINEAHVHLIADFGDLSIRPTVARLKSVATRALGGRERTAKRFWSSGCNMKSLADDAAVQAAFNYVKAHETEGAIVRVLIDAPACNDTKPAALPPNDTDRRQSRRLGRT
ncbi:MAG: hypothetical protein JSS27_02435 [Planctomycetes bacterium]|nr:hypothetical protein [Planctomycetota bacterium]